MIKILNYSLILSITFLFYFKLGETMALPELIKYSLVAICTYLIVNYLFPEDEQSSANLAFDDKSMRGGSTAGRLKFIKRMLKNRGIKAAIISLFAVKMNKTLIKELIALLSNATIIEHVEGKDDELSKLITSIADENGLLEVTHNVRKVIISDSLSNTDKVKFLKHKIEVILFQNYPGKKKYMVVFLIGILILVCVSSIGGLTLILDALRKLFEEGKISEKVYYKLKAKAIKAAQKKITQ